MGESRICAGDLCGQGCRGCKVLSFRSDRHSGGARNKGAGRLIGADHPRAKLTREMADLILTLHEDRGVSMGKLAVWFGVSKWTVRDVVKYLTWTAS